MATPSAAVRDQISAQAELEEELRQAERDFASGNFIDITVEDLERCIEAGRWPWTDESSD